MKFTNSDKELRCNNFCIILADGTKVFRIVCDECVDCDEDNYEVEYFTDELGNKITTPDLTGSKSCSGIEKEVVCVDIGNGCNTPAFRVDVNGIITFITENGDITSQVIAWKAGDCQNEKVYIDTCFLPDQYAIQWSWAGNGDLVSYDASTDTSTYHGKTQLGGSTIGGFALAFKNDTVEPTLFFQVGGMLYKASPEDPIGTFAVVGSTAPATSSYPCFDFDPSGRLLLGDGNTAFELDPDTGAATSLGSLTDVRDGANLNVSPGDWFFDPNGNWFMMARDNRGATFGVCTGTVLWKIDPSTLEATRVSPSCSPVSGTGASWLAAGQYLLSVGTGAVYNYNSYTDTWDVFYNADNNTSNVNTAINDLAPQWVIPDPIPIFGWIEPGCPNPLSCNYTLYTLVQDPDTLAVSCEEFIPLLAGKIGVCEKAGNPFVSDPFESGGSAGCETCPDEQWSEGCSDAGFTQWRRYKDSGGNTLIQYLYGTLTDPVTTAPPNFSYIPCGEATPGTENITTFCNLDNNNTIYRKETTLTDGSIEIVWFDADNPNITPVPTNVAAGSCDTNDPLLPVNEQIICLNGESYVRTRKETNTVNIDGLPELTSYQIIYFNQDGVLYDSGVLAAIDQPVGEPTGWYLGNCVDPYSEIVNEKLCEFNSEKLLLVDSGGVFAEYDLNTKTYEVVSTLSVPSAGSGADPDNFILYAITQSDTLQVVDVNTKTTINTTPLFTNDGSPLGFSAAHFYDGVLYAADAVGSTWSIYSINVATAEVSFYNGGHTGIAGSGTSLAINPVDGKFYITGSLGRVYEVSNLSGVSSVGNLIYNSAGNTANGATFDTNGNLYLTGGNNTFQITNFGTGNEVETLIVEDFSAGANSITYYKTEAQQPSCFHRRYGILPNGAREFIGDYFLGSDTTRVISGFVDCCECGCGSSSGGSSSSTVAVSNFPINQDVTVTNSVELELPTTSVFDSNTYLQGGLQGQDTSQSDYTTDVEAHPVAFPENYVPPVYVQNKTVVNYNQGGGNTGQAEVGAKVWFPESAVVPVENKSPVEIEIPTVSVADFDETDTQGTTAQEVVDSGYTNDVEALPVATEPGVYLNVQQRTYDQDYYKGDGQRGTSRVSMKVALPESFVQKTEEAKQYITTFNSEFFTSAFSVPSAPTNTKEVVIFNNSNAWIEVATNYGTQIVPPSGTIEFSVNPYEGQIVFNSVSIINGTFGGNDNWGLNYKTQS